jgi:hypothetical protein
MRAMCPAVSGEKFSPTENTGYSACGTLDVRIVGSIPDQNYSSCTLRNKGFSVVFHQHIIISNPCPKGFSRCETIVKFWKTFKGFSQREKPFWFFKNL